MGTTAFWINFLNSVLYLENSLWGASEWSKWQKKSAHLFMCSTKNVRNGRCPWESLHNVIRHTKHTLFINKKNPGLILAKRGLIFQKYYLWPYFFIWFTSLGAEKKENAWNSTLTIGAQTLVKVKSKSIPWNVFRKNIILWDGFVVFYFYCIIKPICICYKPLLKTYCKPA